MPAQIPNLARYCVLLVAATLCACIPAGNQSMEPNTHLPGFDLWMPKGIVVKQTRHPAVGTYQVRSGSALPALPKFMRQWFPEPAPSTKVTWRVEKITEDIDVAALLDAALQGITTNGKGKVVSAGEGRWVSTYEFGKGKLVVGYARCEPWLTVMFIIGLEGDVRGPESALKIVQSLRCRIEENQAPPSLQIGLRLPEDFGIATGTDAPTYVSTSGVALVTNFSSGDIARDHRALEQVFGGMFAEAFGLKDRMKVSIGRVAREDGASSTISTLSGDLGELGDNFEVGTLYCPDLDMTAMTIIMGNSDHRTDSVELVKSLHCPSPEAREINYPTIDTVFSAACERGELQACVRLIEFIDIRNATGNVMSREQVGARACELGSREHCVRS